MAESSSHETVFVGTMDEDADRDPEPPARIKKRRERKAELQRQFSERRQELKEKAAADPWDDYVYFYTNADMDEYSVDELAAGYRNRWGIETGYRVLKEEFLPKSASPDATVRTFYFNFAAHLYNLWTAANIRRADDLGVDLSDGKQFTAGRFMQSIEDDPYDLNIPDEPSESRDVFDGLFL